MTQGFSTPEDEIAHLRARIEKKREDAKGFEHRFDAEHLVRETIREHMTPPLEEVIVPTMTITPSETHRLLATLAPRETDAQVETLAQVIADKGIRNAIELARKTDDPELEDDFHRYLVQFLLSSPHEESDVSKDEWKALNMVLYEIALPHTAQENGKGAKEMIALMEQWYASMQALAIEPSNKEKNYYTLEIAQPAGGSEIAFYCSVHKDFAQLFEKVITGVFPDVSVTVCKEDYSIFPHNAAVTAGYATPFTHPALPLKTYKEMEGDPISVILSSFTKLQKESEGMAIQLLIRPSSDTFVKTYTEMLDDVRRGETLKQVIEKQDLLKEVFRTTGNLISGMFGSNEKKDEEKKVSHIDEVAMKEIQKKLESTIVETNIRILTAAKDQARADSMFHDMEASFRQFTETGGNSLVFRKVEGRAQHAFTHNFTYRLFDNAQSLPLNFTELSTLYHIPLYMKEFGQVKKMDARVAQAPLDMPSDGVLLGVNEYKGLQTKVHFAREDRMRHMYVIGQTGTGKTTILKNMIIQDIANGEGCCFIDPHGSDVMDILANIPEHRVEDVVYFDPSYVARPMGLNMLEYDKNFPEQKTFVVNEMLNIFNKLFDMKTSGGPGFEQYFRNATLLVMDHPESGNTLLEIARIFSDKDFRDYKLSKTKNPLLLQFWQNAEKSTGEQGLQNWTQYVTNKFDVFLSNDIMRPIIAQEQSSFNFRDIMDSKKIFLVNLSKGRLGDINSYLLGLIIVGKFLQAALSRVNSDTRPDFFLYIDEFQNVTTPAISTILSEARKYRLSLTIAHQYIAQLPEDIKGAVFGNVGSMATFRVGSDDATYLEKQFAPVFSAADIMKVENYHAYLKLLVNGQPKPAFSLTALPPPKGDVRVIDPLKEMSYLKYGRPREEVESKIMEKYQL